MFVSLTITRYRGLWGVMGVFSMVLFRFFLLFDSRISFFKLLGTGTFDLRPDFSTWGLLATWKKREDFEDFSAGSFVAWYQRFFSDQNWTILCQPLQSHGLWDGKNPFISSTVPATPRGPVAVLTRATIKPSKLRAFRSNAAAVTKEIKDAAGLKFSIGIGEVPFLKQATFSIWENQETINAFAYKKQVHQQVIKRTRSGEWYSEELFARFAPVAVYGSFPALETASQFSNNEVLNN